MVPQGHNSSNCWLGNSRFEHGDQVEDEQSYPDHYGHSSDEITHVHQLPVHVDVPGSSAIARGAI